MTDPLTKQTADPTQWRFPGLASPNHSIHIRNLERELAKFYEAMERERKPDWEKYVKKHADYLDNLSSDGLLTQESRSMFKSASILLNEHWQCFTLKANFVPTDLKIKELEAELANAKVEQAKESYILGMHEAARICSRADTYDTRKAANAIERAAKRLEETTKQ